MAVPQHRFRHMTTSAVYAGEALEADASEDQLATGPLIDDAEPLTDDTVPVPCLMLDSETGIPLVAAVSTVGRGPGACIRLDHPGVSRLHAELVRRGPFLYVADAGLSRNGTFVNGEPVLQALLTDGDVISFGGVRTRVAGTALLGSGAPLTALEPAGPRLSGREIDVLIALCRPAYAGTPFVAPQTALGIADELVVTEAAVKQHLLRLYAKLGIPPGFDRRTRLANAVIDAGMLHRRLCLAVYGSGARGSYRTAADFPSNATMTR